MLDDEAHWGAEAPGLGAARGDTRVERITDLILEQDPAQQGAHRPVRDPMRSLQVLQQMPWQGNPLSVGTVVHAVPHMNWYKVQMGDNGGWLGCCMLLDTGCLPLGPRVGSAIPSGSRVLVETPVNSDFGIILGVIPYQLEDPKVAVPSWLAQGSATGYNREDSHRQLFKGMYRAGGVTDFSCQSPLDATSMDLCWVTELGLALLLSPFEAYLRVNEMCGLFLSYFDAHTALAGWGLELLSAAHEESAGQDEGECRHREMDASYPWEAAGMYNLGEDLAQEQTDEAVHYTSHKGKLDLPDGKEDAQPAYRAQRYSGYEGQGGLRMVARPGGTEGLRTHSDGNEDHGLFCESIGLDGSAVYQSAKSLLFIKRKMAVPRERHPQESGLGDDAAKGTYKFSSAFGGGPEHKVGDVAADSSMLKVAGVADMIAHACNWKRLHPFHYRSDFTTPQESSKQAFMPRALDPLDFLELEEAAYMSSPTPVRLNIDHRYGEVEYYARESFLYFADDGSVVMGGGCREALVFHGGGVEVTCPGDLRLRLGGIS